MDEFAEQLRQIRAALRKGKLDERQRQEKENESLAQISAQRAESDSQGQQKAQ